MGAGFFAAACLALLMACDNLSGPVEWASYTVVYHSSDGSGRTAFSAHRFGTPHYASGNMFAYDGDLGLFLGWAMSCGGAVAFEPDDRRHKMASKPGDTVSLFAVWDGVIVSFKANGGLGAAPLPRARDGGTLALPHQGGLYRAGFDFAGWTIEPGGSPALPVGHSFPVPQGGDYAPRIVSLHAAWAARDPGAGAAVMISFDANASGISGPAPLQGLPGSRVYLPRDLSRPGYALAGWSDSSAAGGGLFVHHIPAGASGQILLYAVWRPDPGGATGGEFAVSFYCLAPGTTGAGPDPARGDMGDFITLPNERGWARDGYFFIGWARGSGAIGAAYRAGHSFLVTGDVTLHAVWSSFDFVGGMILGFRGAGDVDIPETLGGVPVTRIAARAFEGRDITSVAIPSGVSSIGVDAFAGNPLNSVTAPAGLDIGAGSAAAGDRWASFVALYRVGRRAGEYTWDEAGGRWLFEQDVSAGFAVSLAPSHAMAAAPGPPVSLRNPAHANDPPRISVASPDGYDLGSIEWRLGGELVPAGAVAGDYGETLILNSSVHQNRPGTHSVTAEATRNGARYSIIVSFAVEL